MPFVPVVTDDHRAFWTIVRVISLPVQVPHIYPVATYPHKRFGVRVGVIGLAHVIYPQGPFDIFFYFESDGWAERLELDWELQLRLEPIGPLANPDNFGRMRAELYVWHIVRWVNPVDPPYPP
jgi:hypothetical protein